MNDRIHRYLDGELAFRALDGEDRRELTKYRTAVDETREALPGDPAPDLASDVMRRVAALEPERIVRETTGRVDPLLGSGWLVRAFALLWRPRTITFRPALGVAAIGVVAILLFASDGVVGGRDGVPIQRGGTAMIQDGADVRTVRVRFRLDAPSASSVRLAGDFTRWQPTVQLRQEAPGVWSAIVPLVPGVHDYVFVVDDGEWVLDPLAQRVDDGFGGQNSRVAVLVRERQS